MFISLTRNIKQKRSKSQTKVIPELIGSPTQSTSSRAAYSASHKMSASLSSGVTSGNSSDSAGSSERMRRNRPVTLTNGSTLSGEKWNVMLTFQVLSTQVGNTASYYGFRGKNK